jgi:hypothetical protein
MFGRSRAGRALYARMRGLTLIHVAPRRTYKPSNYHTAATTTYGNGASAAGAVWSGSISFALEPDPERLTA